MQLDETRRVWGVLTSHEAGGTPAAIPGLAAVLGRLVAGELESAHLAEELTRRYEEIDLLYGLNELLSRTIGVEEAAAIIVREVSAVVGARRASIMVHDAPTATLRTVAARGFDAAGIAPVPVHDEVSVAARVFRLEEPLAGRAPPRTVEGERKYLGESYLCVPIRHRPTGGEPRTVGVINLTDRENGEAFSVGQRRLVEAIASQIGIAIEQARQVVRERKQQRLQHELALARDLQGKLLPRPDVLGEDGRVAVLFEPAESVGGDFYTFSRLGFGSVGVMLGDVSSHGLAAALVMAVVLAAAGIHAPASVTPDETLTAMGDSLAQKLSSTESHLTVFYGIVDPKHRRLTYASAGHQHAFRIPRSGAPERLETTAPPLGLAGPGPIASAQIAWHPGEDLLCLWTDGLVDAAAETGEPFGEARVLDALGRHRSGEPEEILALVVSEVDAFARRANDDRTLLVLRV